MASPTTIGPFPYFPLEFTKDGAINKQDQFAALVDALTKPVTEAAQTAIDALITELAVAFRAAPPRMRPPIVTVEVSRLDFE